MANNAFDLTRAEAKQMLSTSSESEPVNTLGNIPPGVTVQQLWDELHKHIGANEQKNKAIKSLQEELATVKKGTSAREEELKKKVLEYIEKWQNSELDGFGVDESTRQTLKKTTPQNAPQTVEQAEQAANSMVVLASAFGKRPRDTGDSAGPRKAATPSQPSSSSSSNMSLAGQYFQAFQEDQNRGIASILGERGRNALSLP